FFFQAEDGIRDFHVTGVQTCALPISIQNKGYSIKNFSLENEQIEHISPQTPTDGEPIATGYDLNEDCDYSEYFVSKHLNSLGNLMLISGSHNASIGNKAFKDKLNSYKA